MTPAARVAAAIEILDLWVAGQPVEQALTRWARRSRFAGSKDRAAVRDHVFDALRLKETAATRGAGEDGRRLMLGLMRHRGEDVSALFTGEGFAPAALDATERAAPSLQDVKFQWNLPNWLAQKFQEDLGARAQETALALTARAPVTLRANLRKATPAQAAKELERAGISTVANAVTASALTVTEGSRKLRQAKPYLDGLVEIQDAASQAVVADLPEASHCLDYCAGGGGKALALAAQNNRRVTAHDVDAGRMRDIGPRAARAGVRIDIAESTELSTLAPFDLVLCDAPCSGSGAWRRNPEGKWRITEERLAFLCKTQQKVLAQASELVSETGWLIYATCSVLRVENETAVDEFVSAHPDWVCTFSQRFDVTSNGDGFFVAHLRRKGAR